MSTSSARNMLEKLRDAQLPRGMHSAMVRAIQEKVAADAQAGMDLKSQKRPRNCQQCCKHLQKYLTEKEWSSLQGPGAFYKKQHTVAKRLTSLGLTNPTESTFVLGVTVLYLAHHKGQQTRCGFARRTLWSFWKS